MANDLIRMSGMNSGLDTESIINALTANTKLKATKQERNVLKYEATQEAYRDIISKMQTIKNKYFDILNKDSYLAGASIWNKYSATTMNSNGVEQMGLSVTTSINSQAGDYTVKVKENATQAKAKGSVLTSKDKPDLENLEDGQTYGITVTVGGVEKNIQFVAGASAAKTRNNLNSKLEEAFGESNESSVNSGEDTDFEGLVYVNEAGSIVSREGKGVSFSGIGSMQNSNTLDFANVKTGTNTFALQVGDEVVNVSFQTLSSDYFDEISSFIDSETGKLTVDLSDPHTRAANTAIVNAKAEADARAELEDGGGGYTDEQLAAKTAALANTYSEKISLYSQIASDYEESKRYAAYELWEKTASETEKSDLVDAGFAATINKKRSEFVDDKIGIEEKFEAYQAEHSDAVFEDFKTEYFANHADAVQFWKDEYDGKNSVVTTEDAYKQYEYNKYRYADSEDPAMTYDEWVASKTATNADALTDAYNSALNKQNQKLQTVYDDELQANYETYTNGGGTDDFDTWKTTQASFDTWKSTNFVEGNSVYDNYVENESYHVTRAAYEYGNNLFDAYKQTGRADAAISDLKYDAGTVISHYTESSLKQRIGNLDVNGTKFEINYDSDNKSATINAYTETDDGNGGTVKTPVSFSMTAASGSANTLGTSAAKNTVTQINTSTKLSELGATADEDGNYSFSINGVSFSFDGDTTVNDMIKKVNASSAGVKMSFSSLENRFTVTANKYGLDGQISFDDTDGENSLLARIGLNDDDVEKGQNLKVAIKVGDDGEWRTYETSGNSIEVDGNTFTITNKFTKESGEVNVTIGKDTTAIKDLIKDFVKDYNQLIEDVYKYLDEKPEKDYYFLTDSDKEDLDLTEKQEEKWEEKSKKGLLYHDSITSSVMTGLRTALMGSVEGLDGNTFSLSLMGLKTVSDYNKHGQFAAVDETALDNAINNHLDDIQKLFSDSENGIMKKFASALDSGIGSTGKDKGSLIRKAGLATGSTAKDNEIYNAIKRTKTQITSLNKRYENEQNRLWKKYSNMESLLGTMNSQQSSFMSYFQQ